MSLTWGTVYKDGVFYADSREVAEMIGKMHKNLLRDIDGYISMISESSDLSFQDFFVESTYKVAGNNKTYKCYLLTKKGCDMVANKMTGEKGILFTATYNVPKSVDTLRRRDFQKVNCR